VLFRSGNPAANTAATNGGGGGGSGAYPSSAGLGGGSSPITVAVFPANVLPDTLYVYVAKGGAGGIGSNVTTQYPGETGGISLVAVRPVPTSVYTFPGSSELVCSSGNVGSSTLRGADQMPGNTPTSYLPKLITLGVWNSVSGKGRAPIGNITPLTISTDTSPINSITCQGADGGGDTTTVLAAGYSIASIPIAHNIATPLISGGAAGPVFLSGSLYTGGKGMNGIWNWKPMYGTGGAGGGGNNQSSGNGGIGGKGAYGCGGGGGGFGTAIGGAGGSGGDGLVIIATF